MLDFVKMVDEEFITYKEKGISNYAEACSRNMRMNKEIAYDMAQKQFNSLLPEGINTEGQYFFNIIGNDKNEKIGILWLNIRLEEKKAFIFDIEIDKQYRGKGYGKLALTKLDEFVRDKDIHFVHLNVFGDNEIAINLYKKMGYNVINMNMVKELSDD